MQTVRATPDFEEWRAAARSLLLSGIAPPDVRWIDSSESEQMRLFFEDATPQAVPSSVKSSAVPQLF